VTLPYLTAGLAGTGGVLRSRDEDFVVDEELPYAPSGGGDHVFVRIEKRGMTSPEAARVIARTLGIRDRDIGIAGMKDRRAVTRQWLSLPPPVTPEAALAIALPELRVLEAHRHPHKLRTGHVRANRFVLVVRGAHPDAAARARAILDELGRSPGAPNWYGEQRFGRAGDNAARGMALVTGAQPRGRNHRLDRLMVSALQSQLFNDWLVARLADGLYRTAIAGDVLHKRGGGLFDCDDPAVDAARLLAGELVVTDPMFGDRMRQPAEGSPAAAREAAILAAHQLDRAAFASVRAIAEGTRRDASIIVSDATVRGTTVSDATVSDATVRDAMVRDASARDASARDATAPDATDRDASATVAAADGLTLEVAFTLPGGAYATAVMREVMKQPVRVDADPEGA
jgi:tRNA pseudouridine13 synthase